MFYVLNFYAKYAIFFAKNLICSKLVQSSDFLECCVTNYRKQQQQQQTEIGAITRIRRTTKGYLSMQREKPMQSKFSKKQNYNMNSIYRKCSCVLSHKYFENISKNYQ